MRRRYLVAYDIADDRRRNSVFRTLRDSGDHAQYSVFFCDLSGQELAELRGRLAGLIHHREDQVMILDLGDADCPLDLRLECIGKGYCPPTSAFVV